MERKADARLESLLDNNNYDESQLLSIKVPATYLSYYANSELFDRVDGQAEIRGIQYKYVKRRLYNDSLELICIPDQTAMKLRSAKNDFFKLANDIQHKENKKSSSDFSKNISTDYLNANHEFLVNDFYFNTSTWAHYFQDEAPFNFSSVIENPPENNYPSLN